MAEWTKAPDKALAESGVRIPLSSTILFSEILFIKNLFIIINKTL